MFDVAILSQNPPHSISMRRGRDMSNPEALFKIIEDNNCPLYELGDQFKLSGKALLLKEKKEKTFITTSVIRMPVDKPACRILVEDITAVLIKYENMSSVHRCVLNCSGCSGLIRLEYNKKTETEEYSPSPDTKKYDTDINALASLLYIFPIFQTLDEQDIEDIVPLLKMKKFAKGSVILKKGDPGSNLFIMISGKAEVLIDERTSIATMDRGDVFGEISLLIGTPIGATIRVVQTVRVLYIPGKDFKGILNKFPSLQIYFARLLAERLSRTNDERFEDFASGIIGNLSEMAPSELFQTLNLNRKTGMLNLALPRGPARATFREGSLINAKYSQKDGEEAFFEILREKKGRFKFIQGLSPEDMSAPELGDFMWLLMEGIRKIDEDNSG
ncbi:MAG: Crp/Fnr family transcriptional regulator [Deltaproteobacteria bacterium]|nr:MAG: Crp/Fnr family transcriptional regulator [Deltaproteobacteria bacterium]